MKDQPDLKKLTAEIVKFRDERNWKPFQTPKNCVLGILIEAGELADHFHYLDGDELLEYIEEFKEEIGDELADVLYWVLLTAANLDLDLAEVFQRKMKKNAIKYPVSENGELVGKLTNRRKNKRAHR